MQSEKKTESTNVTLNRLIDLIASRDEAAELRAVKTDGKIDALTDSMTLLNISTAEHRKDNKEIFKTLERHEQNQKDQGKDLATHSETLAVHEVKINASKSTIKEYVGYIMAIVIAVLISKFT